MIEDNYWSRQYTSVYPLASFASTIHAYNKFHIIAVEDGYKIILEIIHGYSSVYEYSYDIYPEILEILKQLPLDSSKAKPICIFNDIDEICKI